jgi:hypothetical protein
MASKFDVLVRYEDGTEDKAHIGQRNLAAFEAQPFATGVRQTTLLLRYAAYDSLRRAGRLPRGRKGETASWEEWDDLVDEVVDADAGEEPDPTQPAAPAAG